MNKTAISTSTLDDKFKEWKLILTDSSDNTRLTSNGVWESVLRLMLNLFRHHLYDTLYLKSSSTCINPIIKRAYQSNYIIVQSIGIRRMLSDSSNLDKQDNSLAKLWSEIRKQTFDTDELCAIYMSHNDANSNKNPIIQQNLQLTALAYINNVIDKRNNKLKNIKKIDKIMVLDKNKGLKDTYDKTSLFIAHAAQNYEVTQSEVNFIKTLEDQTGQLYRVYEALRYFVLFNGTSAITYIESVINNDLTNNQLTDEEKRITTDCWEKFKVQIKELEKEGKKLLTQ